MHPRDHETGPDARAVLVGFDGSLAARAALRFAAQHAASERTPLRVLAVAEELFAEPQPAETRPARNALSLDAAERALADADRFLRTCGPADARTALRFGPAAEALVEASVEASVAGSVEEGAGARLLVLGRPDPWGGLGPSVLSRCRVPVAFVPAFPTPGALTDRGTRREDVAVHDVLVALAGDDSDDRVLTAGREWAVRRRSRLHVVHTLRPRTTTGWAPRRDSGGAFTTLTHRPLADAVVDAATRACLVVLAHHGRETAELLTRIDCPALVLPR